MYRLALTLLLLSLLTACQNTQEANETNEPKAPPNIIYILADDLGYGELGVYGQKLIETPHIDALARSGMQFTQHYSGSPVCAPSRYMLLMGKHPGHARIRANDEWGDRGEVWNYRKAVDDPNLEGQRPILTSSYTMGEFMQDQGYQTGLVGKWGLGAPLSDGIPNKNGFDFFYGFNCQRQAHQLYPPFLWKNQERIQLNNPVVAPHQDNTLAEDADSMDIESYALWNQKDYAPTLMQEEALSFVRNNQDTPFFLYYATPIPHLPLQAPQQLVQYYVDKLGEEDPYNGQKGYFPTRYPRATYAAMITYLDQQVGELVQELKDLGLYDNTLIIFSSDNGPSYTGGVDAGYFDSAGPFSHEYGRTKGFTYEGGIRVPMIASWPGVIEAGSSTAHISAFWDVYPTLADLLSVEAPEGLDGMSFLPTLMGEEQPTRDYLYWEFAGYQGQQAVRKGRWKAVRKDIVKGNLQLELYDLEQDLAETQDLASQFPEVVAEMEAIMSKEHEVPEIDRFKLKALGD